VGILARDAVGGELHQDGLSGHWRQKSVNVGQECQKNGAARTERKLLVDARADNVGVEDEAVGHVVQSEEDRVSEQELARVVSIRGLGSS
jgi:hypothetical protein